MLRTLWTSKAGMNANQEKLDTIGNNIANSNTMGYKKVEVGFKDLLTESLDRQGYPVNDRNAVMGTGVKTSAWFRDNTQGFLTDTGLPTDFSIDGSGYFRLTQPDGSYVYTRDGGFQIDRMGRIVDGRGNKLSLEYVNGRSEADCQFRKDNLLVDTSGSVYLKENGTFLKVAEIPLYSAIGDNAFISAGDNLFLPTEGADVMRTTNADIYQGFLEGSNVDIATEFTDMIVTQRAFELSSRGVKTADEMWGMINNMRR
ncbi:flagellar hook-basal body complex protein [Clostridium paraputrificum]|uniref:flagellar hook-basal body complex protein n=1 Tax=Clostridium TaxID=1485 RepID=UPI003D356200